MPDNPLAMQRPHKGQMVTVLQMFDVAGRRDTVDSVNTADDGGKVNHTVMVNGVVYRLMDDPSGTNAPTMSSRSRFNNQVQRCDNGQTHNQAIHSSSP
jgi:hypothetical protein